MCSEDDTGICTQLSVRMDDDWIVVALVLMQGAGRCRLVLFSRMVGEIEGYGIASCITGRSQTRTHSEQRGPLYHQLDHPLTHHLGCHLPHQRDHPLNHHLGCHLPHQRDHRRLCPFLGAGVPIDRQAPRRRDRGTFGPKMNIQGKIEQPARDRRIAKQDLHATRGVHQLHLTLRGVDPSPPLGSNVRQ